MKTSIQIVQVKQMKAAIGLEAVMFVIRISGLESYYKISFTVNFAKCIPVAKQIVRMTMVYTSPNKFYKI